MTFKVQVASVDLLGGMANVVAYDQPVQPSPTNLPKSFNLSFPFASSGGPQEKDKVIAAAKQILQQAAAEI
jgi:hypothetical protein